MGIVNDTLESLHSLLESAEAPCGEECQAIIEQAIVLLEQFCVHEVHQPIERLKHLGSQLPEKRAQFYHGLLSIFADFGDRHTHCQLPAPFAGKEAFLPFAVREFFEDGERRLAVMGSAIPELQRGDILETWNEKPITEILHKHAAQQLGANAEARTAKAIQTLTFRPLGSMHAPESGVILETVDSGGKKKRTRLEWQVAGMAEYFQTFGALFDMQGFSDEGLRTRTVKTSRGTLFVVQVASFQSLPRLFLPAFLKAIEQASSADGLILDLRGCEEGIIPTAEQLLQLFTTATIEPQAFQFRITEPIRRLVSTSPDLADWRTAVETAVQQAEQYSFARPLTSIEQANRIGQKYCRPIVVLVDALTYSSAEMLAAGFQDHGIAPLLGTAPCTGGGGASPWNQSTICRLSGDEALRPLPQAPLFRVAVRRNRRVRRYGGQIMQGVGVAPEIVHLPTYRDIVDDDTDLLEEAARALSMPRDVNID